MTKQASPVTTVWQGKYLQILSRRNWEFVDRRNIRGIVIVVAVNERNELVLVEQYRPPVDSQVIEMPAGLVGDLPGGDKEPFEVAAQRELFEETGYEAAGMDKLIEGPPAVGISSEQVTFYRARDVRKTGAGGGDASENIRVHEVPLARVRAWLDGMTRQGKLVDPKVYAGLLFAAGNP